MSSLTLKGVRLSVGGRALLGPIDVRIASGQIASLVGPSGSGKSSLLTYVCGVSNQAIVGEGRIFLDEEDISGKPTERRGLGILFQEDLLFPHLSVAGNLAFGLRRTRQPARTRGSIIEEALDSFGLGGFGPRDPASLSGGQRARVALLRTMLSQPKALLLDEPFAHLDADTRDSVRALLFKEIRERQLPALLVTHDEEDLVAAAGPVLRLLGAGTHL